MKKIFTLAALAAICFASCSKNEVIVPQTEANEIGFASYVGKAPITKAADIYNTNDADLTGSGFVVSAYLTGTADWDNYIVPASPNFMSLENVKWNTITTGKWDYTTHKYWPTNNTDLITFVAYAPANLTTTVPTDWNGGKVEFDIDSDIAAQKDLLWAVAKDCNKYITDNEAADGDVDFAFNHKLSRLGISAQKAEAYNGITMKVTNVALGKVFATACTLNIVDGTLETDATETQAFTLSGNQLLQTELNETAVLQNVVETAEGGNSSKLILAPQDVVIPVTVTYTTQDTNVSGPLVENVKTANVTIDMKSGFEYNIILKVSLDKIEFDVKSTGSWVDGTPADYDWTNATPVIQ